MRLPAGVFLTLLIAAPLVAADYKVSSIGALTDTAVSEAMRGELQATGYRIAADSAVLCEVWFRKVVPQKAAGADYSSLAPGTFVGVIRYPARGGDYRGQAIKPGFYALRFQTIPQDGNHLGVSPTFDFFLLSPVAEDKDPKAAVPYEELIKLSKAAAGTNHPHPLHLPTPGGAAGTFKMNEEGHGIFEVKVKAAPAGGAEVDLPLAVVLIGKSEG